MNKKNQLKKIKSVGMISGGLDSALAAHIIHDLGIEVYGIHFVLPWGCGDEPRALKIAQQLRFPLEIVHLDHGFVELIKEPRHGTGAGMNPCIDCRIYNLIKARQYMMDIQADFIFTGEIIGQRPMSQMRHSLALIEKRSQLTGRLLRPLCAKLLEPTEVELDGKVDRSKLFSFSGRSRADLQRMGRHLGITDYTPTGGGCLLTDKNFSKKLKDSFLYGYDNLDDIINLKWGRHFRLSPNHKAIVGRDECENQKILHQAQDNDLVFSLTGDRPGPIVLLKGNNPDMTIIKSAAFLVKKFSRFNHPDTTISYWPVLRINEKSTIQPADVDEKRIMSGKI
jgi:tRNA-uridine 2-sulfurtransferase